MGKSLIIPGADFSQNGIQIITEVWYTDTALRNTGLFRLPFSNAQYSTVGINSLVRGKTINAVRIAANSQAGSLVLSLVDSTQEGTASLQTLLTIEVPLISVGVQVINLGRDIFVPSDKTLVYGGVCIMYDQLDDNPPISESDYSQVIAYRDATQRLEFLNAEHTHGIDFGYIYNI